MKFLETHFEDYISTTNKYNLHPKLQKTINKFPSNLGKLGNLIFWTQWGR